MHAVPSTRIDIALCYDKPSLKMCPQGVLITPMIAVICTVNLAKGSRYRLDRGIAQRLY